MVSDKYKVIFVHQKKAGGTSIKRFISQLDPNASGLNIGVLDPRWSPNNPKIEAYYKFTVVRNPYDRFVSAWKYCLSTRKRSLYDTLCYPPQKNLLHNIFATDQSVNARVYSLIEYIRLRMNARIFKVKHFITPYKKRLKKPSGIQHDYEHTVRQQSDKIYYSDGTLAVDQVVFLENLAAGLSHVSRKTGMPLDNIPQYNQNRNVDDDYRNYFDEKSIALFKKIFTRDLYNFPYDFDKGLLDDGSGVLLPE